MAILYGARGGSATTSNLYTIDAATGTPTSIGAIGFAVTGLAFDPTDDTLYGVTSNNSTLNKHSLITIDIVTGDGTVVGDLGDGANACSDICFATNGTLYGWTTVSAELVMINKATGAFTPVNGFTGEFGGGLMFISTVLWHLSGGDFETVNPATGQVTALGFAPSLNITAATYNSGIAYASSHPGVGTNSHLNVVDLVTGNTVSTVTVFTSGGFLDAVAWDDPGTPPTPPANDNFANRITLTPTGGEVGPTDAAGSTIEASEPGAFVQRTIWYSWTAPFDCRINFDFSGTSLAADEGPELEAFTGASLAALVEVEDLQLHYPSEPAMYWDATSGTDYKIQIASNASPPTSFIVEFAYTLLPFSPQGVCVAFDSDTFDERPAWYRLDG